MNAYAFYEAGHTIQYNEQGVERIELLPGTHDEVKAFKIYMKAGSVITPELYKDSSVFYVFGHVHGGVGILKDEHKIYNLDTVCFYAPNYEHEAYSITAVTDFEFVQVIAHMDSHDWERAADTQLALPFFRRESECDRYDQDQERRSADRHRPRAAQEVRRDRLIDIAIKGGKTPFIQEAGEARKGRRDNGRTGSLHCLDAGGSSRAGAGQDRGRP